MKIPDEIMDDKVEEVFQIMSIAHLKRISPERRLEVFSKFCTQCGDGNPHCHCWNDE
jgi:hypothetical protein